MRIAKLNDLLAFQMAVEFKQSTYQIIDRARMPVDHRYRSQLFAAASSIEANLAEGFARDNPGEFAQFIRYALGSLAEAEQRLVDGIDRKYFLQGDCRTAFELARRCRDLSRALHKSQQQLTLRKRDRARVLRPGRRPPVPNDER